MLNMAANGVIHKDLAACNAYGDAASRAAEVQCPTLLVLADDDKMTPAKKGLALADRIDGAESVVIENTGHMMMTENPDAVFHALKGFVF